VICTGVHRFLKIALYTGAFFFVSYFSSAQNKILELLPGSEKLGYNEKTGAHRLVGSVNFVYQGNTMYCDSAHYFDKSEEVRAYGNVHITKDGINLFCDSLYYNGKTRKAKLWGHVKVRDMEYKLTTDTLEYDAKKGRGTYLHGGKIESISSNEVLTSRIGYMYPDSKNFFFSGKVKYKNDDLTMSTDTLQYTYSKQLTHFFGPTKIDKGKTHMTCERGWYNVQTEEGSLIKNAEILDSTRIIRGDTLLYMPKIGRSIGKGHVFYTDTTQQMIFEGNYALSDEQKHIAFITGNALATKVQKDDTVFIHADTLMNITDSITGEILTKGYYGVKIYNRSVQAICDSILYDEEKGQMQLFKQPIIWSQNAELRGARMTVWISDSLIRYVEIKDSATAIMEIDSGRYYNQVAGKRIDAYFKNNELIRTDVGGNARTIFYPENEEKTDTTVTVKRLGMNRLFSRDLRIYLDSGEITGVTYYEKPDGIFYPMDQIDAEEQFIREFKWTPLLRPKDPVSLTLPD
jgi:lipopolysaccharide export system protein LptA